MYSEKLIEFLKLNLTSHEFQFFSVDKVASSIIDFRLYLSSDAINVRYDELVVSLIKVDDLFKNQQFVTWTIITLGRKELRLDEENFLSVKNDSKKAVKVLKKYFGITRSPSRQGEKNFSSIRVRPYSKDELLVCDRINLTLHDFQFRVKDRVTKHLIHNDDSRVLVQMPTGSGKTRTAMEFLVDHIRISASSLHGGKIYLWFTNTLELSQQAFDTFIEVWKFKGDREIGVHRLFSDSDKTELYSNLSIEQVSIIFVGFQKFNGLFNSTKSLDAKLLQLIRQNNVVSIVDEAHISLASTYSKTIDYLTDFGNNKLIGLTATPGRNGLISGDLQNRSLSEKFHGHIAQISFEGDDELPPLEMLQKRQFLANIVITEIDNTSNLKSDESLDLMSFDLNRNIEILKVIQDRFDAGKSILIFSVSTAHSVILKSCLEILQIPSEIIDNNTSKELRKRSIEEFKMGKLKVLINFGVLSTGFDAPILNCLIIARPISSLVLFSQLVGRALRGPKNGGNLENEIILVKDTMINYPDPNFLYSYWDSFWN